MNDAERIEDRVVRSHLREARKLRSLADRASIGSLVCALGGFTVTALTLVVGPEDLAIFLCLVSGLGAIASGITALVVNRRLDERLSISRVAAVVVVALLGGLVMSLAAALAMSVEHSHGIRD